MYYIAFFISSFYDNDYTRMLPICLSIYTDVPLKSGEEGEISPSLL